MRVAIIGAGSAGITAGKACFEENIDYVCFERSNRIAGLWNYHDEDVDGIACVMKTTTINSSKEMTAFSDFPPPKEYANYMHHRQMLKYLLSYAESFGFLEHVKYNHEVLKVQPASDYEETGRWNVTTRIGDKNAIHSEDTFDGVMVCTGHHGYPNVPVFKGQSDFMGKIIHTHSLRTPEAFKDQRVMVVGIGNSGLDAAVEISNVAKQVYLSTRTGAWIMFRHGPNGYPMDATLVRRFLVCLGSIVGEGIKNAFLETLLNTLFFDHETFNLRPKHRFSAQHVTINDHFLSKLLSGTVIVKGDFDCFTEKGVIFEDEDVSTKLDAVVLATGYKVKFPFLSSSIINIKDNEVPLYKYVFSPQLKHASLAIIGLIQPVGSLFNGFEAQSRWYVQLLKKKVKLPSYNEMMKDIKYKKKIRNKKYTSSPRHDVEVDYIPFLDEIYSEIGAKPNLVKIALTDPILFYHVFFKPAFSYQYRLQGPHVWPGARKAILEAEERMHYALQTRKNHAKPAFFESIYFYFICYALTALIVFGIFFVIYIF